MRFHPKPIAAEPYVGVLQRRHRKFPQTVPDAFESGCNGHALGRRALRFVIRVIVAATLMTSAVGAQVPLDITKDTIKNGAGVRMLVETDDTQPALRIVLPGHPLTDRAIRVVFPEHVTVRKSGSNDADAVEHIYMWREGHQGEQPIWQRDGQSIEYEKNFDDGIRMIARATLEENGILFDYEFNNSSDTNFNLLWAPTDPRLTSIFHDARLQRTYVHHKGTWGLLAENTPSRLSMPLNEWLPARYLASFTAPIPDKLVDRRSDGIAYYYNPLRVDQPVVATLSEDRKWIVASFSHDTGNVWSNPELTCQHVDETKTLRPGGKTSLEMKMLILQGSLDQVLKEVIAERSRLE
jgi:hypothetical protein